MAAVCTLDSSRLATPEQTVASQSSRDDDAWIHEIADLCEQASRGDFEVRVLRCDPNTARGRLGLAINDCLDRIDGFVRQAAASLEHASKDKFYRRVLVHGMVGAYRRAAEVINNALATMNAKHSALAVHETRQRQLADEFAENVGGVVTVLGESAEGLRSTAEQLARLSQGTMGMAAQGSRAAIEAAENVHHLAIAGNSLSESEKDVRRRALEASRIAQSAVAEAARTAELMTNLTAATQRINGVITLIAGIARQTNLLSLNASIEAARAGNSGQGFAVVATEVRKLADETHQATNRIAEEIRQVQGATSTTATAIGSIAETVNRINSLTGEVSEAVDRQETLTSEIHQRLVTTNTCVKQVETTISETSSAAENTNANATQLLTAADTLSQQTGALRVAVEQFLERVCQH